jgi:hypothetical protein
MKAIRGKLTYSNVVSTLCLVLLLGGGAALAAGKLAKNSVGTKQIKNNAVTAAKIKNGAISGAKVQNGSLTGIQVNASTLGTVPSAQTAQAANSLAAPEAWHEVGASGQPEFLNSWQNLKLSLGAFPETVAFYKDQEGVVHLRGEAVSGAEGSIIFELPAGYRPANDRFIRVPVSCVGTGCPKDVGSVAILGPGTKSGADGAVISPVEASSVFFDGVTFRAAS